MYGEYALYHKDIFSSLNCVGKRVENIRCM